MSHLANRIQDSAKTTYPKCPKCSGRLESPVLYCDNMYADCLNCYVSWPLVIGLHGYEIVSEEWGDPTHIMIQKECGL